jgi:hypothetical protein
MNSTNPAALLELCPFGEPVHIRNPKTTPPHRNDKNNYGCVEQDIGSPSMGVFMRICEKYHSPFCK